MILQIFKPKTSDVKPCAGDENLMKEWKERNNKQI